MIRLLERANHALVPIAMSQAERRVAGERRPVGDGFDRRQDTHDCLAPTVGGMVQRRPAVRVYCVGGSAPVQQILDDEGGTAARRGVKQIDVSPRRHVDGRAVGDEFRVEPVQPLVHRHGQQFLVHARAQIRAGPGIEQDPDQCPEAPPSRQIERGGAETIEGIDIGPEPQQQPRHIEVASFARGPDQGRAAIVVGQLQVGPASDESFDDGILQPLRGVMHRRFQFMIPGVDGGASIEQEIDHRDIIRAGGPMQRSVAVDVDRLDVGARVEQECRHRRMTAVYGGMKRRAVSVIGGRDGGRVGRDQIAKRSQVTGSGCGDCVLAGGAGGAEQQDRKNQH